MELSGAHPVERAHYVDAEIAREPSPLALEAGSVHHDRLRVLVVRGVRDEPHAVAAILHPCSGGRGGALVSVAVEHDEPDLAPGQLGGGRGCLPPGARGHNVRLRRASGDVLLLRRPVMGSAGLHEQRAAGDDQKHELERGDEREEHGRALPRLDGELGLEAGVVAIFLSRIAEGRSGTIFGDGAQTRDYIFVGDVVRAFVAAAHAGGGVFNVGTGVETSVLELWEASREATGIDAAMTHDPPRLGELARSCLDPSRAAQELGWRAEVPLAEGLRRTWEWIREE